MIISQDIIEARGRVRPMERHDVPVVSGLMARLARHHGDAPAIDAAGLEADLFGPAPALHGLVVERFGYVVGYALMTHIDRAQPSQRELALRHVFVLESSRGLGLGKQLVGAARAYGREAGCAFLAVGAPPENRRAQDFYRTLGFEPGRSGAGQFAMSLQ
ncbi:MAG: GNAT family N-acetyltransferase [Sphingomonadales bacterium]|nr:GNAT family N-acetyltransferase [Sphingomonadales bacterium]